MWLLTLQYKFAGTATDMPLMKWLDTYTFPTETQMQDQAQAQDVYSKCIRRVLSHGTTTAMIYGTVHLAPNKTLADICQRKGLRSLIGKVHIPPRHGHGLYSVVPWPDGTWDWVW